jgi:glycosyltransferase involved in cell wall biosynthesis
MNDTGPLKTDSRVNFIPFFKYCNDRRDDSDYDRLRFIAIGKFEPRKNHLLAVRAFAAAAPPPSTLTLIGEVTSDQHKDSLKEVEREIDRLSIEGRTSIYTNLTPSEVKSHLAKHNVCLMVSRNELASISQIEAMASGLAVICTTDNGTAHYIDDTCGLHCEPNISSIADAIAKYANSKDLAKIHGRNAQERLKTDFSIDSAFHSFSKLVNP